MRDPRAEAFERVGGRWEVRVLEPSPPAVGEPPFFADDPVAGGDVSPVERPGTDSWAAVCTEDPELRAWCEERWLVRGALAPLPDGFVATRLALHAVAEHVVAPSRHAANGKIGLRYTYLGFGTPFFGDDRQVRVEDGLLAVSDRHIERREHLSTLRAAAAFVDLPVPASTGVYAPTTAGDLDAALVVDQVCARALGDWFGFCASALEQLRAEAGEAGSPSRLQLWPEHFDLAVDLGPPEARANFGGSPGDDLHPEPYLYVGPWVVPTTGDPFWNEPFGASLAYQALLDGADPLAFFRTGKALLQG
ncbi:MAG: hypothetical protein ACRD2W_22035 [Acidimicrobiales bacterium]